MSISTIIQKAAVPARALGVSALMGVALYFIACAAMGYYAGYYDLPVATVDTSALESALPFDLGLSN